MPTAVLTTSVLAIRIDIQTGSETHPRSTTYSWPPWQRRVNS